MVTKIKTVMPNSTVEKLRKQTIKSVMDLIMLSGIKNGPMSGYDAIAFIHDKFGILISSGTIYSHLYALERNGLIEGMWTKNKRVYELTEKGEQTLEAVSNSSEEILNHLRNVLVHA